MADPMFRCKSCGKGFRWKPELAGKQTTCKCGVDLRVPDEPDNAADLPFAVAETVPVATAAKCVNCNAPLKRGAVICVRCGMDQQSGRRQATQVAADPAEPSDRFDPRSLGSVRRGDESNDQTNAYASGGMVALELGLWAALLAIALTGASVVVPIVGGFAGENLEAWSTIASVGSSALNIVAFGLMLFVPKAAGARWMLFAALGCLVGSVVAALFTTGIWDTSFTGLGLAIASGVLSFTAVVLFLLFLKQLADFFGFGEVTEKADKVVGLYIVLGVAQFAICIPFVGLLVLGLAIYTFWLYVSLLVDLYRAASYRRKHGAA
ncbi:MAG: hypothetical protein AAGE65_03960 [Planctomycetota bacterium]